MKEIPKSVMKEMSPQFALLNTVSPTSLISDVSFNLTVIVSTKVQKTLTELNVYADTNVTMSDFQRQKIIQNID